MLIEVKETLPEPVKNPGRKIAKAIGLALVVRAILEFMPLGSVINLGLMVIITLVGLVGGSELPFSLRVLFTAFYFSFLAVIHVFWVERWNPD